MGPGPGRRIGTTLVAGVVLWLVTLPAPQAAAAVPACWERTSMPNVGGLIVGADDGPGGVVWGVGHTPIHIDPVRPFAVRWSGRSWRVIATPLFRGGMLSDVVVVGPDDVWAVGEVRGHPLVLRWNGTTWHRVWVPSVGSDDTLSAIDVTPGGRLLAVGAWWSEDGAGPLIVRRSDAGWRVALRRVGLFHARLNDVSAGDGGTWAVGEYGRPPKPLALRFVPGEGWRRVAVPAPAPAQLLSAVAAAGPDDALAAGWRQVGEEGRGWLLRWNGDRWAPVAPDRVPGLARSRDLADVAMRPSGEAWVAGARALKSDEEYTDVPTPLVLHRVGGRWIWESVPRVSRSMLSAVLATPTPWLLGSWDVYEDGGGRPLAFRC